MVGAIIAQMCRAICRICCITKLSSHQINSVVFFILSSLWSSTSLMATVEKDESVAKSHLWPNNHPPDKHSLGLFLVSAAATAWIVSLCCNSWSVMIFDATQKQGIKHTRKMSLQTTPLLERDCHAPGAHDNLRGMPGPVEASQTHSMHCSINKSFLV